MNYKVDLIIDNRERDLCKMVDCKTENLDLGDIIVKINGIIVVIIERKEVNDLCVSIKDGRYREQKNRIIHSLNNNVRKIYLLEGNDMSKFNLPISAYNSVIYNTMIRDNLHIIKTNNIEETIKVINSIYKRCQKFSEKIYNKVNIENTNNTQLINNTDNNYEYICHQKKRSNITKEVCCINQYNQIPGISSVIAKMIYNKYGGMYKLYNKYNTEEKQNLFLDELSNMKYKKSNRRIGKITSKKICNFLFYKN